MQENPHFHLLGLGGIGMSALARLLKQKGYRVSGEDKNKSLLLDLLQKEGIESSTILENHTTLVYSSAISKDHPQFLNAKEKNLSCLHRTDILQQLLTSQEALLVAGTHGKTTTSSLLSHVLLELNQDPSFAIGGILKEKNTNAMLGTGKYFVVEADESDGSFLTLKNDFIIITNLEEEHLEYWQSKENLIEGFRKFVKKAKSVIYCKDDPNLSQMNLKGISYGLDLSSDIICKNIRAQKETTVFDIHTKTTIYKNVTLSLMGKHNALNALAVFALLESLGFDPYKIIRALTSFKGVKKRLDFHRDDELSLIDDYAHHPTEIRATLDALSSFTSKRRLIAVFQPHRSTRLKKFYQEFLQAFDKADVVIITDIYEVGETVDVCLEDFANKMANGKCIYVSRKDLQAYLSKLVLPLDVLITLGAGDIVTFLEPLKSLKKVMKTALLFGGTSLEHEISIRSAKTFYKGLLLPYFAPSLFYLDKSAIWHKCSSFDGEKKKLEIMEFLQELLSFDLVIPSFHSGFGEDGIIQGFLRTLHLPYISPDSLACSLSMNKILSKRIALSYGVKTAKFVELKKKRYSKEGLEKQLENFSYPLFVKPSSLGSSYGVFEIKEKKELFSLVEKAFSFDEFLLIEEKIIGDEIEVGLIGNDDIEVGFIAKIPTNGAIHTYETKYGTKALEAEIPAKLKPEIEKQFIQVAKKLYQAFHLSIFARIDFFLKDDEIYFNEINPIPGMTSTSPFPQMFIQKGIPLTNLISHLASLAIKRKGL